MRDSPLIHKRQIHRLTKEIYRLSKEIYLITKEFYQVSKDGVLQMIIDSINTDERYNERMVSPLRVTAGGPSGNAFGPFGNNLPLANARGQTVVVEALRGLGCPSGTACNLPLVSR